MNNVTFAENVEEGKGQGEKTDEDEAPQKHGWLNWIRQKRQPIGVHVLSVVVVATYAAVGAFLFGAIERHAFVAPDHVSPADAAPDAENVVEEIKRKCFAGVVTEGRNTVVGTRDAEGLVDRIEACFAEYQNASQRITDARPPEWPFASSFLFAFTVMTTIGYGNVAPVTVPGRSFCMVFGLVGIPLTMLAIANVGKFLTEMISTLVRHWRRRRRSKDRTSAAGMVEDSAEDDEEVETGTLAAFLGLAFLAYMLFGAILIPLYERDMDFFSAVYFNFVTLTTVGLGDIVPKSEEFLWFSVVYITVGLSLTTIGIEVSSDYLRRLHFAGRKATNVGNVYVWFGGQKVSVNNLVKNIAVQFNVPQNEVMNLNLDTFVEKTIEKVEYRKKNPQKLTIKPPIDEDTFRPHVVKLNYADEDPTDPSPSSPLLPQKLLVHLSPAPYRRLPETPPLSRERVDSLPPTPTGDHSNSAAVLPVDGESPSELALSADYADPPPPAARALSTAVVQGPSRIGGLLARLPPIIFSWNKSHVVKQQHEDSSQASESSVSICSNDGLFTLKKAQKPVAAPELGRREFKHDPRKRYEMFKAEWERKPIPGIGKSPKTAVRSAASRSPVHPVRQQTPSPQPPKRQQRSPASPRTAKSRHTAD